MLSVLRTASGHYALRLEALGSLHDKQLSLYFGVGDFVKKYTAHVAT